MKKLFYLFILLLSFSMTGCRKPPNPDTMLLEQAENCMETDPENVLRLLKDFPRAASLSGKEQADYALHTGMRPMPHIAHR